MSIPEKLNLWDRLFNRYRREIIERGSSQWIFTHLSSGRAIPNTRHWVEYRVIDRLTGSETIERDYLNNAEYQ